MCSCNPSVIPVDKYELKTDKQRLEDYYWDNMPDYIANADPDVQKRWVEKMALVRYLHAGGFEEVVLAINTYDSSYRLRVGDSDTCAICEKQLDFRPYKNVVDHIRPLRYGGCGCPDNLQRVCPSCNTKKRKSDRYRYQGGGGAMKKRSQKSLKVERRTNG